MNNLKLQNLAKKVIERLSGFKPRRRWGELKKWEKELLGMAEDAINSPPPKSFHRQYRECSAEGMLGEGEVLKFKNNPDLLPMPWHQEACMSVKQLLDRDPEAGLKTVKCLRFGGICNSGHKKCQKFRNVI